MAVAWESASAIREWLTAWKPDRIIFADEVGLQYMRRVNKLLNRRGARHVGSLESFDEKEGCTIMVVSETMTGCFGRPQIIFGGAPQGTIVQRWNEYSDAVVQCTKSHFQTSATFIDWLKCERECFGLSAYVRVSANISSSAPAVFFSLQPFLPPFLLSFIPSFVP
eukprot:GHVU01193658.1.p1 GENE.GHVU01193658.1~~GHVU01193658.1.p1  ORF type:complete len:166 (-),score=14.99 GHVU01193658.1:394-891(-)